MANQQIPMKKVDGESPLPEGDIVLTPRELAMMKTIIQEMKKPYVDQEEVAKKEAARQRLRAQREESERQIKAVQDACNHLRDDNTSRVAWHVQLHKAKNLYVTDGYCQLCNKHFAPGVEGYEAMLRVPVGKAGLVS